MNDSDCPADTSVLSGTDDDVNYPPRNVLADNCMEDGSTEWRSSGANDEFIIVLGCRQDIKTFFIKNGVNNYQTQNFSISIGSDPGGPWHTILESSLNTSESGVSTA